MFNLRFPFYLDPSRSLDLATSPLSRGRFRLSLTTFGDNHILEIRGFRNETEAESAVVTVRREFARCVIGGVPIEANYERSTLVLAVRDGATGSAATEDSGYTIYRAETTLTACVVNRVKIACNRPASFLLEPLARVLESSIPSPPDDRTWGAVELYRVSLLVHHAVPRLVTLISGLELLCVRKQRADEELRVLDRLIDIAAEAAKSAGTEHEERPPALCSALGSLRNESAGSATSRLVATVPLDKFDGLDTSPVRALRHATRIRGAVLHGTIVCRRDLEHAVGYAEALLRAALRHRLEL